MYPIYLFNNKEKGFIGIDVEQFEEEFYNICEDHRKNNKARAFAFILSDFHSMQATQIIMDNELWNNLHTKSGEFLTIFHLNYKSEEVNALFREGETDFVRQRFDSFFKKLTNIFEDTEINKINMPAILFFQTHAAEIIDYFIIELNQKGLNKDISELDF